MNSIQVNKVLRQRQQFLVAHVASLAKRVHTRDEALFKQSQHFEKALKSTGQAEKMSEMKS